MTGLKKQEEFYNIETVAKRFDVTPRTIYRWLMNGRLSGQKIGRSWRIPQTAVDNLYASRLRGKIDSSQTSLKNRGHYLVIAPERDALAGVVLKLIELGLQHDYAVFCGCWTQSPEEQRTLMRTMGLSPRMLEAEGKFFIRDFAADFARDRAQGILQNWREWAEKSKKSGQPIMGIGTPALDCWGERPQDLVEFEADLQELWRSVEALSLCVYPLVDFVPEGSQRLGTLISHHDGLIMWSENGPILMKCGTVVDSIFNST